MNRTLRAPTARPDAVVFPGTVVLDDSSVLIRVDRMRTWAEGVEFTLWIESLGPGPQLLPALLRQKMTIRVGSAAELDAPRRRRKQPPQLETMVALKIASTHLDVEDGAARQRRISGTYWLDRSLVSDTVACAMTWPSEGITDARFLLEVSKWEAESPRDDPEGA